MRAVLGIDAAWTNKQPSGVALVAETTTGWRLVGAASSYDQFLGLGRSPERQLGCRPMGSIPDPEALLAAAFNLIGRTVDIVAIDMPLSSLPITRRRSADDQISRRYGAMKASTHTPSVERPGPLSDAMRGALGALGYDLETSGVITGGLIEVYPHPALIELSNAAERLRYKEAKAARYWPDLPPEQRKLELLGVWQRIVDLLDGQISGVRVGLPLPAHTAPRYVFKAFEDVLDAVVCAWVGMVVLDGRAIAYGDDSAAIWVPAPISKL